MLSFQDDESKGSEKIWLESGFFGDQRVELTILKANFPENMLGYINQGTVSLVKGGEKALYLDFVVLGQIMPVANVNPEINLILMISIRMKSLYFVQCITNQQGYMVALPKN